MAKKSAQVGVEGLKKTLIRCFPSLFHSMNASVSTSSQILEIKLAPAPLYPSFIVRNKWGMRRFKQKSRCLLPSSTGQTVSLLKTQMLKSLTMAFTPRPTFSISPSVVLNFKPGEAFVGRNIANMVPQFDQLRQTEIGAVIEYAVKSLKISHCGGIGRLMNLPDCTQTYDFIDEWVKIGLPAKKKVLQEAGDLPFEHQDSLRNSMANLLTYPFVRDAVVHGTMTLRGGYNDFVNGSFEQWKMCTH
ncbi:Carbonic anhydrase 2, CA2 isoform 1 [Hibiscus syriacus]|uniref:Carbonic anhydrase n=1 Tax=Hibiscus syriacus TaxID=106335 RepID=A0A6A2XZD7_HIBSY|nr:Carbonic anhydrase 2, CA2 isoform 1 [Hibiscus syriacus]